MAITGAFHSPCCATSSTSDPQSDAITRPRLPYLYQKPRHGYNADGLALTIEQSENTQLKYIVALLLMLGCRKRELLDAKWEHFDLERRSWRIPLSKSGKSRHVSLSSAALAMLNQPPRWDGCPYVLPNPKSRKPFTGIHVSWDTARKRADDTALLAPLGRNPVRGGRCSG